MPLVQGRKRRAQPDDDDDVSAASSPEPATQRRRTSHDADNDISFGGDDGATQADGNLEQMVKKMVRLALACEYQRRPIRRADISEKVLGNAAGRRFKDVFNQAQVQLRGVFGMEMVELPAREKTSLAQRRAAAQKQSQQTKTTPTSWFLTSVLPPAYRDPTILSPPAIPTSAQESTYTALTTLLVSLIALSGSHLPDAKMDRYLRRLDIEDSTPLGRTEEMLKRCERDGYVVKVRENNGTGEDDVFWIVGPRGKVEVDVAGVAREVYGEGVEEQELERRIARSLGVGESEKVMEKAPPEGQGRKGRKKRVREEEEEEEEEGDTEED